VLLLGFVCGIFVTGVSYSPEAGRVFIIRSLRFNGVRGLISDIN